MRINRAVATSVASVLALGGLAACSNSTSSSASPAASSSSGPASASPSTSDTMMSPSPSLSDSSSAPATAGPASGVLKIGMPNGQQTENFNPFLGSSAGAALGSRSMIYEPLIMMNPIDPAAKGKPWLATEATWSNGFQQVDFTIRDNAKWSDGQAVTGADVAFTFNLIKANPSINGNNLPFDKISAAGNKVTVTFKESQFTNQTKVVTTIVVPEHIWKTAGDPGKFANKTPVGSGPYTLTSFTPQTTTLDLRKDGGYWQPLPQIAKLLYTAYADNAAETTALANGDADWGFVFIPDIEKVYTAKDPDHNKLWFPPNLGAHGLWLNTDKTHAPFDDPALRKAMNMVINRDDIFQIGEAGYFYPEVTNITGIPTPAGEPFIAADYKGQDVTVDVEGAKKALTDAGYKYNGADLMDKNGKPVTLTLTDPAGWSDYQTDLSIIADSFKQIGINAKVEKANEDAWFAKIDTGDFDAAMHWTNGGATPYDLYENIMNGDIMKPIGKPGSGGNYGRFQNAEATAALKTYATAADDAKRTAALATIEKIFVDNMPVLITSASNVGAEYSTKNWTGWPDKDNPWTAPQPTQPNALQIVLALKPAS